MPHPNPIENEFLDATTRLSENKTSWSDSISAEILEQGGKPFWMSQDHKQDQ